MARYYFNIVVRGRKAIPDPEGDELAGDKEALQHAEMVARDMLERRHWYKRGLEQWAFEITNGSGRKVGVVRFSKTRLGGVFGGKEPTSGGGFGDGGFGGDCGGGGDGGACN